jgi:hypothetical protein
MRPAICVRSHCLFLPYLADSACNQLGAGQSAEVGHYRPKGGMVRPDSGFDPGDYTALAFYSARLGLDGLGDCRPRLIGCSENADHGLMLYCIKP